MLRLILQITDLIDALDDIVVIEIGRGSDCDVCYAIIIFKLDVVVKRLIHTSRRDAAFIQACYTASALGNVSEYS